MIVTWLTERKYVRTYASTDCKGGVRETIKREGGVPQACLGKSISCILDIHKIVNWQLSKHQHHITISRAHVSTHRGDVFSWKLSADQLIGILNNLDDKLSGRRPEVFSRSRQLLGRSVMSTWRSGRDICWFAVLRWTWAFKASLRSRRLEVVGERENGRARGRHAKCPLLPSACYAG